MARLPTILSAVALGLGLVAVWQGVAPVAPVAEAPAAQAASVSLPPPATARFVPPPQTQFAVINARSLFDPARGPVAEPAPAGTVSTTPPDVTLAGVAIGPASAVALLQRPNVKVATTVRVGDDVDGWKVDRIAADRVVLKSGASTVDVMLRKATGLLNPPVAAPASAPASDPSGQ